MSVEILLIPLAVAAVTAVQAAVAKRADGKVVCQVNTRMRDEAMLSDALRDTGATVTAAGGTLDVSWPDARAAFTRGEQGIWGAHFTGVDQERAVALVTAVDTAYGRQVQQAVVARLRAQAPTAGLRLESETVADDASVKMVFEVQEERA